MERASQRLYHRGRSSLSLVGWHAAPGAGLCVSLICAGRRRVCVNTLPLPLLLSITTQLHIIYVRARARARVCACACARCSVGGAHTLRHSDAGYCGTRKAARNPRNMGMWGGSILSGENKYPSLYMRPGIDLNYQRIPRWRRWNAGWDTGGGG